MPEPVKNVGISAVKSLNILLRAGGVMLLRLGKYGVGEQHIYPITTPEGEQLLEDVAMVVGQILLEGTKGFYRFSVNYAANLKTFIDQADFDYVNPSINTENFPTEFRENDEIAIELLSFPEDKSSDEVITILDRKHLRPLELIELIAFGIAFPEVQRIFPVVALGSAWNPGSGGRVPFLWGNIYSRHLRIGAYDYPWAPHYRFAAVANY